MATNKKVLVTGGSGFVGSHLVDALVKKGYEVVVIDIKMRWLNPKAKYYKTSVTLPKTREIIKKERPAYVFHLAAQVEVPKSVADPFYDAQVNILGIVNVLEGCRAVPGVVKKVIAFSTGGALYGNAAKPPTSEVFPPCPASPYGIAKLTSERYLDFYHRIYNIPYVAVRPANIYGPRQASGGEAGVISIFTNRLLKGKTAIIDGTGNQTRDFIFVDDIVRAAVLAMTKPFVGSLNVGTGKETSMLEIFRMIKKFAGSKQPEIMGPARKADILRSVLDSRLAKRALGWSAEVEIKEGLKRTVEWFRTQK